MNVTQDVDRGNERMLNISWVKIKNGLRSFKTTQKLANHIFFRIFFRFECYFLKKR